MEAKTKTTPVAETPDPRRALRIERVLDRVGVSKSTLYEMIEAGTFPAPLKAGAANGAAIWLEGWVDDYIAARIAERDAATKAA